MSNSHQDTSEPLLKSTLVYYAVMGFPLAMLGIPVYLYLPQYYADEFGLSLSTIGLALLAARLFDVITDPLIGWLSDRLHSQFSRQKQVLAGLVILIFALYLLFFPLIESLNFWYLFILSFITYQAWTIVQVPYQTMVAEISLEPLHKTQLTSAREAMAILGVLFILIVPFALELPTNQPEFYQFFMVSVALSLTLGALLLFGIHWLTSLNKEVNNSNNPSSIVFTLKNLWLSSPQIFSVMPAYFLNNLANALPATLFVFFVSDYLQLKQYTGLFLLIYFLSGLLALPFWILLSKKLTKEKTWQLSMWLASLFFSLVFWLQPNDVLFFALITVLTGLSLGIDLAIPASIQADMTQKIQHHTEVKGLVFGIWGMLTKLALAIAVGVSLPALEFLKENQIHFESGILLLYAGIPIALKIVAIFLVTRHQR
ncbi:MFS transporter [Thiomicrorhabdus sp. Kp2]|uniref:MFS transporter n=1 Tax=Thiomicrorhabdus sp. Kp2 TaxID=1123518 RepID=UPI000424994F|nr:MFS transporter [Thiomicrorhabdus sp. Kp2]